MGTVTVRSVTSADDGFLYDVYVSTRDDLTALPLAPGQRDMLVHTQYQARTQQYAERFPGARYRIVCDDDEPVGYLCEDRTAKPWRLIDMALLPAYRRRGIGGIVLTRILTAADAARAPMRLHVARGNPARRLYERHGFRTIAVDALYREMERPPVHGSDGTGRRMP